VSAALPPGPPALTDLQRDYLALYARGLTGREIAAEMLVSPETVKCTLEAIRRRIGARNGREAAVWAARHGLLPAEGEA
jgi:DNA-binding CsgD family transcriptional regulator